MSRKTITLAQVLEIPPGTEDQPSWVDDFEAIVSVGQGQATKTGKMLWPCVFSDPDNPNIQLKHKFWENPQKYHGALCLFSGSMRMGEYNGQPELKLGKKTLIAVKVANALGSSAPAAPQRPSYTPPHQSGSNPTQQPPMTINGASVGMAIKAAIDLSVAVGLMPHQPDFWPAVKEFASDILRLSYSLEHGQLAAKQSQRQSPPTQTPPQRPQPGPDGSAFPPNSGPDEDVQF